MIKFSKCYLTVKKTSVLNLQKKVCLTYTVTTHNKYRFRIEEVKWKIKIDSSKKCKEMTLSYKRGEMKRRWYITIKLSRWWYMKKFRVLIHFPSKCLNYICSPSILKLQVHSLLISTYFKNLHKGYIGIGIIQRNNYTFGL